MRDQDHLRPGGFGGAQGLHHIPGGAGVGQKQHHVPRPHQAGSHQLQVAVASRAELCVQSCKPCADIIGQQHAAALSQAKYLLSLVQQSRCLVHSLRGEGVLCPADGC